jgi:hypothetical protein
MSLPGWQALHAEIEPLGATVVTVALDIFPEHTYPWIDAATPTHPSLIDTAHVTGQLFGFQNIPMAVWIDEEGMLVRPAEGASIERNPLRDMEIPAGLDPRTTEVYRQVKEMPDSGEEYRAAIVDWVRNGATSRFALSSDEVVAASQPRSDDHARAAACFELGQHLLLTVGHDAAVPWWREAHRLFPANWTYKRQAWTLVTTPAGAEANDLMQGPNDVYEGNWLDDVLAGGGGANYTIPPRL